MPVALTYVSKLTAVETFDTTLAQNKLLSATDKGVTHNGLDKQLTLPGAGLAGVASVPMTTPVSGVLPMTAGALTIDLRVLVGSNGLAVDGNGLKLQAIKLRNDNTGGNPITIAKGATNGYLPGGGTAWSQTLPVGGEYLAYFNEGGPDIDGTHKTLDVTGTGTQAISFEFVLG